MCDIAFQETEFSFPRRHTRETEFRFHKGYNEHNDQQEECDMSFSMALTRREKRCESSGGIYMAIIPITSIMPILPIQDLL